jgi:hypothetical protein
VGCRLETHALLPLLFNFALEYVTESSKQTRGKLTMKHQLLVPTADDNLLGKNLNTIKKHTEALSVTSTEAGLKANTEKHEQSAEKITT